MTLRSRFERVGVALVASRSQTCVQYDRVRGWRPSASSCRGSFAVFPAPPVGQRRSVGGRLVLETLRDRGVIAGCGLGFAAGSIPRLRAAAVTSSLDCPCLVCCGGG